MPTKVDSWVVIMNRDMASLLLSPDRFWDVPSLLVSTVGFFYT
jgi:hypothetical protein